MSQRTLNQKRNVIWTALLFVTALNMTALDASASHPSQQRKPNKTGTTLATKALKSGIPRWRERPTLHRADVTTKLRKPNPRPSQSLRSNLRIQPKPPANRLQTFPQYRKHLDPHGTRSRSMSSGGFRAAAKKTVSRTGSSGKKWLSQASTRMRDSLSKARQHVKRLSAKVKKQLTAQQRRKKAETHAYNAAKKRSERNSRDPVFNIKGERKAYEASQELARRKYAKNRVASALQAVRNAQAARKGTK